MDKWTPAAEGTGFEFTEILKPLEPFRDRVNVVSGLAHPYVAGAGGGDVSAGANHTRAAAVFLTRRACRSAAPQAHLGVTVDQVAAQHIGQDTPLPSLELSIEEAVLSCGERRSAAPTATRSRGSRPTSPLPMQNNPQVVFEQLFGDGSTDAERRARRQQSRSLLDSVIGQVAVAAEGSAGRRPPPPDAVSRRRARDRAAHSAGARSVVRQDSTLPRRADRRAADVRGAHQADDRSAGARLQAEITRVSTLMFARELSNAVYPGDRHPRCVPQPVAPLERSRRTWIGSRS